MKVLIHLRILLYLGLLLFTNSCNKDEPIPEIQGITVTVQDDKTDKPIANADVKLTTLGKSLPTLDDGIARFKSLDIGDAYQIQVSKTGYATQTKAAPVEEGKNTPVLFKLKPILERLPAQLDFAVQERIKKFDIINNSDNNVGFSIKINNSWISVEPTSGTIPKDGGRVPITVTVDDRGRIPAKYDGTLTLDFGGAVSSVNYDIFMTVPNLDAPSVSSDQPVGITRTSAEVLGTIMSVGKTPITNHGHVWSESQSTEWGVPGTYTDFKARSTGQFTSTIGPLKPNTIYYVRAYARNENGINYSKEEHKITTSNTVTAPGVRIVEISNITAATAKVSAKITNNGGSDVTVYGVAYSDTDQTPNADTSPKQEFTGIPANGDFIVNLLGLKADTKYYVAAYARNGSVVTPGVSPISTFNTPKPVTDAKVITSAATNVDQTTVTLNGNVSDLGSLNIADHGFVWSRTNANPELNAKGCDSKSLGSLKQTGRINTDVSGISKGTSYYYKAYVKPDGGQPIYGSTKEFTTTEQGLILYYPINGDASDASGNGNDGESNALLADDRYNNPKRAYDISRGGISVLNNKTGNFRGDVTYSFWAKIALSSFTGSKKSLFGKFTSLCFDEGGYNGFLLWVDPAIDSKIHFFAVGEGGKNSNPGIYDQSDLADKWHMITIVKSGSTTLFYLDDDLFDTKVTPITTDAFVQWTWASTAQYSVVFDGRNRSNCNLERFNAIIDDFRIYNYALPKAQVEDLYKR